MTLSQLTYFLCVCECGNMTRAADILHITQPSISSSIKSLEEEFGMNLFSRMHNRLVLTDEGKKLQREAAAVLASVEHLNDTMSDACGTLPVLRLGVSVNCSIICRDLIDGFHLRYPNGRLNIQFFGSRKLFEYLIRDNLDIALICRIKGDKLPPSLRSIPLLSTGLVFATFKGHPLAGRKSIDPEEAADSNMVIYSESVLNSNGGMGNPFASSILNPMKKNILFTTNQLNMVKDYIINGVASAFILKELISDKPEIVAVPVNGIPEVLIQFIWKKKNKPVASSRFLRYVKEAVMHGSVI